MPYVIRRQDWRGPDHKWVVLKAFTGKLIGTHDSKEKARAQIYAIYSHENKA